ncbi:MAG TPA: branched-chain amino acid ABC transporter permease [Mobilitalea sp.]|nr:branched-chain amino acid ABC transporter permease [Mobilitalea sp.]
MTMKLKAWNNLNKSTRNNIITVAVIAVIYVICQVMISAGSMSNLMQGLLVPLCYYSILAVSLNLTVGILGELSLGHAGFMCIGAFTGAFFSKCMQDIIENNLLRYTLAIIIGAGSAALFGALIGVAVLRLRGDYLAIVTLAFGEIIKNVMNVLYIGLDSRGFHFSMKDSMSLNIEKDGEIIINGAKGIFATPKDSTFTIAVILLVLTYIIINNLVNSRSGRAIKAIRDNRIAAESVGIDITKFKIIAFSISAAMAGVAGVLYSHNISTLTATPKNFGYNMSIMILVFVVLGGMGNLGGSIIAAVILTLLPEYLRFMQDYRMLIYAIVLIAMMIFNWNPTCITWRKTHSIKGLLLSSLKKSKKGEA